jgi:O-antigen ligase
VSFLGIHDFAAFSAAALAIALAGIALGERRRIVTVAAVAGTVGSILAASVFAFSGIALAAIVAGAVGLGAGTLTVRRTVALAAITLVVGGGVLALRGGDVTNFLTFLDKAKPTAATSEDIQTGSHRVVLGYIGLRIWVDHPLLGVGFERSTNAYGPYVDDAKRKFPHQAPTAFPSPKHAWGVQNFWIQTLADVGIVGLVLVLATFAAGLSLAWRALGRARMPALIAVCWILVAAATWNANGILAGIPLDALMWFGFGLAATVGGLE